ncbi:MAG: hypothetical protein II007_05960 [Gammaproteobacteria bacterium]|nr:hypothetical protein [Gammaproteobacteria bacterium]
MTQSLIGCSLRPPEWQGRFGGYWGDGIYDSIQLEPGADGQVAISYWRDISADDQQAKPLARFSQTNLGPSLLLQWTVDSQPGSTMNARYLADLDQLEVRYQDANTQGVNVMSRHGQAKPANAALSARPDTIVHEFRLHAPWAEAVSIAGEMTDWRDDQLPMVKGEDGNWRLTLHLAPGIWQYKLVVDGRWQADPLVAESRPDGFGGHNSVITLGEPDPRYQADPAIAAGSVSELSLDSRFVGAQKLMLYRPAGNHAEPLPWLLLLHGYGAGRRQWLDDGQLPALLDHLIASGQLPPLAVVMPDGGTSFYLGDTEKYLIEELLPAAASWGLSSDPRQRLISGMSMGGFGSFYLSYRHPQAFAAALPLSGYFDLSHIPDLDPAKVAEGYHLELWCGQDDHISTSTNQLLAHHLRSMTTPPVINYAPGGHTWRYWQQIMPEVLARVAELLGR